MTTGIRVWAAGENSSTVLPYLGRRRGGNPFHDGWGQLAMPTEKRKPAAPAPKRGPADWRAETLDRIRALIIKADPEVKEEWKWKKPSNMAGIPAWSRDGIICTGESYKSTVKLTFARGASLPDPAGAVNASLEGGTRRAIDLRKGEPVNARAFTALVKAAVAHNAEKVARR